MLAALAACRTEEPTSKTTPTATMTADKSHAPAATPEPTANAAAPTTPATASTLAAPTPPGSAKMTPKNPALLNPSLANQKAPDVYKAKFSTSKGDFVIEVHREWAPQAADRFYNLVKIGFYDDERFFRVVEGFMVQWGINGDPAVNTVWRDAKIPDDAVKQSNKRGFVTFATSGPNARTTQLFVNFVDGNTRLDAMNFAPFGKIAQGMDVVDSLYKGYGEGAPRGNGPDQGRMQSQGNEYLKKDFAQLDFVKSATIVP
jgi:peptidyl-prolyl cis-trans isomerase A (cyclophilin A)